MGSASERKYALLHNDYEEIKGSWDNNERSRKGAADELANLQDTYNTLYAQNAKLAADKRKLEADYESMRTEWEDAQAAAKAADGAAKVQAEWKAQGNTIAALEGAKKNLEASNHALAMKLEDAEAAGAKGSKKALGDLKAKYDALFDDYESSGKIYLDLQKSYKKQERAFKELAFQADEDAKNNKRMSDLVGALQGKLKQYKIQSEEAEALANDNLLKYRKALNEKGAAEERADAAESASARMRKTRAGGAGGAAGVGAKAAYSISRKSVFSK